LVKLKEVIVEDYLESPYYFSSLAKKSNPITQKILNGLDFFII